MRIESIDLFYLSMPKITTAADGTQDSLLVRIRSDSGIEGWGECDASPLVTIAAFVCPPSHGNIINLRTLLSGERIDGPDDIERLHRKVSRGALDIAQATHALSGADIALWDLVGKARGEPVWSLLEGWKPPRSGSSSGRPQPKLPYASVLFGDTAEETRERARGLRAAGFEAAKFGWGPMGRGDEAADVALVRAAREGLGDGVRLMVDAGVAWGEDHETALSRARAFAELDVTWLEEPLLPESVDAYARLTAARPGVGIAAGEGCDSFRSAVDLVENGGVDYIQIDAGRIGGITTAYRIRRFAERAGVQYVNHTFKSHLSLAAALHVFATEPGFDVLEYPGDPSPLSRDLVSDPLLPGADGRVVPSAGPGLGVTIDEAVVTRYLRPVRLEFGGEEIFCSASPGGT